ncbi:hypothetical protein [Candidatus Leptofilum sp.]|uniref:hypothetical protein n=1 Tax=Candidatus Leptofilum sp. TaxID=3241576 RepID=UPI003B597DCD
MQVIRLLLYAFAVLLAIYVIVKIIRDKKLTASDGLASLGIVVAIILAQPQIDPPLRDFPIPIAKYSNDNIRRLFPEFPIGEIEIRNTRFLIPEEQSKVSTRCASFPEWESTYEIFHDRIDNPESVRILIAAGNTQSNLFFGEKIGEIELIFEDYSKEKYELILGDNIREWRFESEETVIEAANNNPTTRVDEAYRGLIFEGNEIGILDLLILTQVATLKIWLTLSARTNNAIFSSKPAAVTA